MEKSQEKITSRIIRDMNEGIITVGNDGKIILTNPRAAEILGKSAEELEQYSDRLYYLDQAVRDRYEKASDEMNYEYNEVYPDPYDLEAMEAPVAYGLSVEENTLLNKNFSFVTEGKEDKIVLGFVANGQNVQLAHDLAIYLLTQ